MLINNSRATFSRAWYLVVPLTVSLIILTFGAVLVVSAGETTDNTITVCQEGPPHCDYDSIQAGIDAASNGDTVLVHSGTYTERLTLKSQITLSSSDGSTATIVTSDNGPIISALSVYTATMQGFTIRGQGQMTSAVGIFIDDSSLSITSMLLEELHGKDRMPQDNGNRNAIGIQIFESGTLSLTHVTIQDLSGGDGNGNLAGDAVGIKSVGSMSVMMVNLTIMSLEGGVDVPCGGGGEAIGIDIDSWDNVEITLLQSKIMRLTGGSCFIPPCTGGAKAFAPAIGVRVRGGSLLADSNFIDGLTSGSFGANKAFEIIRSDSAILNNNAIGIGPGPENDIRGSVREPEYAPCQPGALDVAGIEASDVDYFKAKGNSISGFGNAWNHGYTYGIWVNNCSLGSDIRDNVIDDLVGPGPGYREGESHIRSAAIHVQACNQSVVAGNRISRLRGGMGLNLYIPYPFDGGDAAGICMSDIDDAYIWNNVVTDIEGGGSETDVSGMAYSLYVAGSSADIYNNTFYKTFGGIADDGIPAESYGVFLTDTGPINLVNNIVTGHETGISVEQSLTTILDYQGLWDNDTNYVGMTGGAHDVVADPGYVDPFTVDLHLKANSTYIDSGSNIGTPNYDFEGDPRSADGDGDGVAFTDIGADEFWLGLRGSYKSSTDTLADPGGIIDYSIVILNTSAAYYLTNSSCSDPLPQFTMYVPGTLAASSGSAEVVDNVLSWTGDVDPNTSITITFQVQLDQTLEGPYAIVNLAELNDKIGLPLTLRSLVLVDPLVMYLPIIAKQ